MKDILTGFTVSLLTVTDLSMDVYFFNKHLTNDKRLSRP